MQPAPTNKIMEIVNTGRIAVTVVKVANTMRICKITATPPVLTAEVLVSKKYIAYYKYSNNELYSVFGPLLTLNKFKYNQFAACRADKQDRGNCQYWKNSGYCHRSSKYYGYMQDHCYATCTNCKCK